MVKQLVGRLSKLRRRFAKSFADSHGILAKWTMLRCLEAWAVGRLGLFPKSLEVNLKFKDVAAVVDVSRNEIFPCWAMWYDAAYETEAHSKRLIFKARYPSGKGRACKALAGGSIPSRASSLHKDARLFPTGLIRKRPMVLSSRRVFFRHKIIKTEK
jgi:hypothetical protein